MSDLDEYRKSKFQVVISAKQRDYDDDFKVAITHNGYQWQAIGLSKTEMVRVILAMQEALK